LEFIKKEYGEKNIIYATVHYEKKTPHMHFGFVPITKDGRLSAKEVLGNKVAMSKLQDRFNDFVNEKGYNLERGEKDTGRKHIEMMKFKEKTLNKEIQKLHQNLETIQNIDQRIKEVDNFDNKTKRILNQVTMNKADYEAFKNVAKAGLATIHKFEDLKKTSTETFQELNQKNQELQKENNYFISRNQQLFQENRKLKQENNELKKEIKSLKREIKRLVQYARDLIANTKQGMKNLAEKLKNNELYKEFNNIFRNSHEVAHTKYIKDQ
jgi:chromosome segregation ATPase